MCAGVCQFDFFDRNKRVSYEFCSNFFGSYLAFYFSVFKKNKEIEWIIVCFNLYFQEPIFSGFNFKVCLTFG